MIFIGLVVKNKEPDVFFEENVDEDGEPTYEERTCIISLVNRMFSGGRQGQLTFNEILAVLDANGEDTTLFFKLFLALPKSPVDGTRVLKLLTRKSFDGMLLMYDHRRESEERNISIYAERAARAVDAAPRKTTATPANGDDSESTTVTFAPATAPWGNLANLSKIEFTRTASPRWRGWCGADLVS
jgi:hypothetical protein